jgi:hypothetical protein
VCFAGTLLLWHQDSTSQVWIRTQLEDLLATIWRAEAEWRFDDRLDLALKLRRPLSS